MTCVNFELIVKLLIYPKNLQGYYLHGLSENDQKTIASFFFLLSDKLPKLGSICRNKKDASIWIIDVDSPSGSVFWNAIQDTQRHTLIAISQIKRSDAMWLIKKPFTVNGAGGVLTVCRQIFEAMPTPFLAEKNITVAPDNSLEALSQNLAQQIDSELTLPDGTIIITSAIDGKCWSNSAPKQWLKFFSQLSFSQPSDTEKLDAVRNNPEFRVYSIDIIQWCLALSLWQGKPSPQASSLKTIQLKCWPNFTQLPHHPQHIILTSYLIRYPSKIQDLAIATKLPLEFIQNFINATMASNLLSDNPAPTEKPKMIRKNPLRSLLKKFGITQ